MTTWKEKLKKIYVGLKGNRELSLMMMIIMNLLSKK